MKQSAVIIGAGISGLYAATLLEKAGVDYVILEARDRTGGRVLSGLELAGTSAGIHVDMGAAWFWPDIQPDFAQLIERLNLPVIAHGRRVTCSTSASWIRPRTLPVMGELPGVFQAEGRNAGADGGT
jgi:monoamine oxidase